VFQVPGLTPLKNGHVQPD